MAFLVHLFAILLTLTFAQSNDSGDNILFFREKSADGKGALLLVSFDESGPEVATECGYVTDQAEINEILNDFKDAHDFPISSKDMKEVLDECGVVNRADEQGHSRDARRVGDRKDKETTTSDSETTTPGYDGIPVIFPGTKWCGAGDRAKSYDDLGLHQDTDRCCRAHDLCNDTLAPGETKNNLTNTSPFTALSCKCDNDFYNCLDRINSVTSNTVGNMYFNVLRRQCYKMDYPESKKCKKYYTLFKLKCKEYYKDTKAPKVNQWVKAKKYKKIPFPGPLTITLPPLPI